jgi:23S rRNA (adenine2503-C2)-methyltransferase
VIIAGINDSMHQARKLADYAKRIGRVKVNLIPYNKTGIGFKKPTRKNLILFHNFLNSKSITCTIRESKGEEISAGCGQLAVD